MKDNLLLLKITLALSPALYMVQPSQAQSSQGFITNSLPVQQSSGFDLSSAAQSFFAPMTNINTANVKAADAGMTQAPSNTGDYGRRSVGTYVAAGISAITGNQRVALPPTFLGLMTQDSQRGLPSTSMDSFVSNAGGAAEAIYGDEGEEGPPPYFGFSEGHRIERGINESKLTTGHRSALPDAWGYPQ